ncbi:nedd8-activating enzyme E1 regulatory subunit-like protein [Thermochaetoides thermophila DSM 1495]|uniref:NEDD8-activating enzyme E1 regulatory subunit n=1 Tax=Chaetomium thermophilum (strain DSM 1495 / CBS 144.50 / IMI 039719) TaxID=759272 RepID=G0S5W2_CHATD|nr:nedd8-activating enzyme E1 regulatory subunit-like protein [Thermochaetoides thermophila DSM 1495]EGS21524.1 nedd8-activating enzyme E1 regulatory subunit-like protein [Thermochaetoides thermophila DSM 1495]
MTEIIMSQTPPILHRPSEKERKYDRQLRLWAASGQSALESANILLVNSGAGAVGAETLKNLVLPGIGRFAIYDEAEVTEADLGVNFFLDESYLGQRRSRGLTELLTELNPEVKGSWYPNEDIKTLEALLTDDTVYTVIMYTHPIRKEDLAVLEAYAQKHKTPLVAIHSAGFYSYFQINLPGAFPIVETHPDETATTDLRLLKPWPELVAFAQELTRDIDNQDDFEHGHIPYVAILLHYLEQWKETHDGRYPTTYKEKTEFRSIVQRAARTNNPEGGEENFDEAAAAVLKTLVVPSLPSGLKQVFEYKHADPVEQRSGFWIIADAVKAFFEKHQCLPLPGKLPDMKAQSKVYVQLQNLYKEKARKDAAEVLETVRAMPGGQDIDPAEVELFCKNAAFVRLINATGGSNEQDGKLERLRLTAAQEFANDENTSLTGAPLSHLPIYLALRATSHATSPISAEEILEGIAALVPGSEKREQVIKAAQEVARAAGGELHNISALTGGMVAQETIKIVTKQYVPIDNTCIFDGVGSRCQVLQL